MTALRLTIALRKARRARALELGALHRSWGILARTVFKAVITLTSALIAILANAIVSQATTSRLIFSMARDRQIPGFFAAVDQRRKIPVRAILVVALLSTGIGLVAINSSDLITSMVNFGSLAAYCLLHVAVLRYFAGQGGRRRWFAHRVSPILGAAILLYALWKTQTLARTVGVIWLAAGVAIFWLHARAAGARYSKTTRGI